MRAAIGTGGKFIAITIKTRSRILPVRSLYLRLGDGDKEAHEEIVNNGANSMPVPRENDRCFRPRTNTKKAVRFSLPTSLSVSQAALTNNLKLQVLPMKKAGSGQGDRGR
jgi:hypothetical protein